MNEEKGMNMEYYKTFSHELNCDMEYKVYGYAGTPCLVFPAQNGRFYDFENFGMIQAAESYIMAGQIQFFCCDSIDEQTWSNEEGNCRDRIEQHERWYHYIIEEFVPRIYTRNPLAKDGIMTCGCSLGAMHALNFLLRRPDIFHKVLGMSGIYHADYFFKEYHDELTYRNSPADYMLNTPQDHPNMKLYRKAEIALCCGRGAWEQEMENSLRQMESVFEQLHIDVWIDYWGYDVSHDWYWWKRQIDYFLQFMV